MRLTGNINQIRKQREDKNADVALYFEKVEYVTYKKDGKYHQPFSFEDELDTPLVITGDCLSQDTTKHTDAGDYAFLVYDKVGDDYVLNENKQLFITVAYDFDADVSILTEVTYEVTVSNDELQQIKRDRAKPKNLSKHKKKR
ncbi:hypothetical protein ACXYMU_10620 [Pontibacter sp. CAU 1760]